MKCEFCGEKLRQISIYFYVCENHGDVVVLFEPYDDTTNKYFLKNGYEISIGFDDSENALTDLSIYDKAETGYSSYVFFGYDYGSSGNVILELSTKMDVTPDNFDFYLNKLLSLRVFS